MSDSSPQTPIETGGKPQMQILKCRDDRNPIFLIVIFNINSVDKRIITGYTNTKFHI